MDVRFMDSIAHVPERNSGNRVDNPCQVKVRKQVLLVEMRGLNNLLDNRLSSSQEMIHLWRVGCHPRLVCVQLSACCPSVSAVKLVAVDRPDPPRHVFFFLLFFCVAYVRNRNVAAQLFLDGVKLRLKEHVGSKRLRQ